MQRQTAKDPILDVAEDLCVVLREVVDKVTEVEVDVALSPRPLDVVGDDEALVGTRFLELVEDRDLFVLQAADAQEVGEGELALGREGVWVQVVLDRGRDAVGAIQVEKCRLTTADADCTI